MKNVSLLGQYDKNYDFISKKTPSCYITKTERIMSPDEERTRSLKFIFFLQKEAQYIKGQ